MYILPKKRLELLLQQVPGFSNPKVQLEQYATPAATAATFLHLAAYTYGDIVGRSVLDLGCGTGRLAIGAAILGAYHVTAIDIDPTSLREAVNASHTILRTQEIDWILSDVEMFASNRTVHTVLQNPPFGVQVPHQDRRFLEKALALGDVIYTLHAAGEATVAYIRRMAQKHGGTLDQIIPLEMEIPHQFDFHEKARHKFHVFLYRIVRRPKLTHDENGTP